MAKFCTNCGNRLEDYYNVCPNCGTPSPKMENLQTDNSHRYYFCDNQWNNNPVAPTPQKGIQFGWVVLGFFIPLAGWIMWGVWNNTKPDTARAAGIAGTVGFLLNLIIYFS